VPKDKSERLGQEIIPSGILRKLKTSDLFPGKHNPRHLFDEDKLRPLKDDIKEHGVLVPLMVYQIKGQNKYSILDGERRYRCCLELEKEGIKLEIPANVVEPPSKIAGLLYMFSVHNLREEWELMPTALSLKIIMDKLGKTETHVLKELTSLSEPQIKKCKILLEFPEWCHQLSLDPNPKDRIPSNFWIELYPVLDLCKHELRDCWKEYGRDGILKRLVEKYRIGAVKSVIHFRRIMEAYEVTEGEQREAVLIKLREYLDNLDLGTRKAFDAFILDPRRIQGAISTCDDFIKQIKRLKIDYTLERDEIKTALEQVREFVEEMLEKLKGTDDPDVSKSRDK
jgi:ParB/RepB/Spo0J family partition protein